MKYFKVLKKELYLNVEKAFTMKDFILKFCIFRVPYFPEFRISRNVEILVVCEFRIKLIVKISNILSKYNLYSNWNIWPISSDPMDLHFYRLHL